LITVKLPENLEEMIGAAVSHYWDTRLSQQEKQEKSGKIDYGLRGAVTGGAQMDGFIELFSRIILSTGLDENYIKRKSSLELPGYFRPTKEWDLLVVKDGKLIAAIEAKSQVGPSFGNNFNNRTEEAIGSALDLWTAYREGAFHTSPQPFLGYFFMLEDCQSSTRPVRVKEPYFDVFPEFKDASYMKRYEIFCRKLVLERHYTASAYITSNRTDGPCGISSTPSEELSIRNFARALIAHVGGFIS
jgi:hypothetical protein